MCQYAMAKIRLILRTQKENMKHQFISLNLNERANKREFLANIFWLELSVVDVLKIISIES